jgi:hypothetical protein
MGRIHTFEAFLSEGVSKIKPGKRMVIAGLAGAPTSAKYIGFAKKVLDAITKNTESIKAARAEKKKDEVKKLKEERKAIIEKAVELKNQAKSNLSAELKSLPAEKKKAAAAKADAVIQAFDDAIKKREKAEAAIGMGDEKPADAEKPTDEKPTDEKPTDDKPEEEKPSVDTDAIEKELESLKDEMKSIDDKFYEDEDKEREDFFDSVKTIDGYNDGDEYEYGTDAYDKFEEFTSERAAKQSAHLDKLQGMADKIEALEKQLEDAKGKNESYYWYAMERLLEFDAQSLVDKAKEKLDKTEDKLKDMKSDDGGESSKESDDDIEAEL